MEASIALNNAKPYTIMSNKDLVSITNKNYVTQPRNSNMVNQSISYKDK